MQVLQASLRGEAVMDFRHCRKALFGAMLCLAGAALAAPARALDVDQAADRIDAAGALAHVRFLADDRLEGRAAGTAGNRAAGEYITGLLERCGLEPGGDALERGERRSWYQAFTTDGVACRNIVAVRRGRGAAGAEKDHVVIGAHYDHVGHGEAGGIPSLGGIFGGGDDPKAPADPRATIHNGADDNASGTAAVLEIARAFAALDPAPERSVVFVLFDGEEHGLWGSVHYVAHPLFPLERCAAMINLDMVGRSRAGRVQVIGASSAPGLDAAIAEENARVGLTLDADPFMVPNSDHHSFYARKVPIAFFCTGLHADYHRPGDDWEKVNTQDLARIARLTFRAAARVADGSVTPRFVETPDAPPVAMALEMLHGLTGSEVFERIGRGVYGGIGGAFLEERAADARSGLPAGRHVRYVAPGSRAERAGLREGDRVLQVAGRPAAGALAEMRLRLLARGKRPVALEVARGGERLTLTLPGDGEAAPREAAPRREPAREPGPAPRSERREF